MFSTDYSPEAVEVLPRRSGTVRSALMVSISNVEYATDGIAWTLMICCESLSRESPLGSRN